MPSLSTSSFTMGAVMSLDLAILLANACIHGGNNAGIRGIEDRDEIRCKFSPSTIHNTKSPKNPPITYGLDLMSMVVMPISRHRLDTTLKRMAVPTSSKQHDPLWCAAPAVGLLGRLSGTTMTWQNTDAFVYIQYAFMCIQAHTSSSVAHHCEGLVVCWCCGLCVLDPSVCLCMHVNA